MVALADAAVYLGLGISWVFCALTIARWLFAGAEGDSARGGLPHWETVFAQHRNRDYLGTRPRTRYGHTTTVVGDEIVLAFGYFYDFPTSDHADYDGGGESWETDAWGLSAGSAWGPRWRLIAKGDGVGKPPPRLHHAAVARAKPADRKAKNEVHSLVVFGGSEHPDSDFEDPRTHKSLNDLWELDVRSGAWLELAVPAHLRPPARNCFSAALLEGQLFIFGGFRLGDLWKFRFERRRWKRMIEAPKVDHAEHPGKRAGHAAVTAPNGKDMYVYGGFRYRDDVSDPRRFGYGKLSDLWLYKHDENKWQLVPQVGKPGGREYHAMELAPWRLAGEDHMGLATFAGITCKGSPPSTNCSNHGSLAFFSIKDRKWRRIRVVEEPLGRYFHSMVMYRDGLWIFGGESNSPHMYHNSVQRISWPVPEVNDRSSEEL